MRANFVDTLAVGRRWGTEGAAVRDRARKGKTQKCEVTPAGSSSVVAAVPSSSHEYA
jgi:hypothetical protein